MTGTRRRRPQGMSLGTASPIRSLCKPTYTKPNCDLTALQGYPSAGRMWLYLVVHETEVPHVIAPRIRGLARDEEGCKIPSFTPDFLFI